MCLYYNYIAQFHNSLYFHCVPALFGQPSGKMVLDCSSLFGQEIANADVNGDLCLQSIWNLSNMTCALLAVCVCANIYVFWATSGHRLPVRLEAFSSVLRHSCVVDLSWGVVVVSVLLDQLILLRAGDVALQCERYDINKFLLGSLMVAASGVVVGGRQALLFFTFHHEMAPSSKTQFHPSSLLTLVAVVAVAGFTTAAVVLRSAQTVDLPLCHVVTPMTSRVTNLVLVPVCVAVVLGVVAVARGSRHHDDIERPSTSLVSVSPESLLLAKDVKPEVNVTRRKRVITVTHVTLLTVFYFGVVLVTPASVDRVLLLTGSVVLDSVWSAFTVVTIEK